MIGALLLDLDGSLAAKLDREGFLGMPGWTFSASAIAFGILVAVAIIMWKSR
jgi:hypothetical protein